MAEYRLAPLWVRGHAGHQAANCAHRETALNTSGSIALAPGDAAEERAEVLVSSDQNCGAKVMGRVAERFFVLTTARRQVSTALASPCGAFRRLLEPRERITPPAISTLPDSPLDDVLACIAGSANRLDR